MRVREEYMATLKELISQVDNLDTKLSKLHAKASALNTELSSGHYGSSQIKELANQLDRVNAAIAKTGAKKIKIVDELSTRDFDILLKQIDTLSSRINVAKGFTGLFKTDDPQYQKLMDQIKTAERALSSLESRKFSQFTAAGTRKNKNSSMDFSDIDLENRFKLGLAPQYKYPIGPALPPPITDYGSGYGPKQDTSTLIESKLKALAKESAELQKIMGMKAPDNRSADEARLNKITDAVKRLTTAYSKLSAVETQAGSNTSVGTNVSGGLAPVGGSDAKPAGQDAAKQVKVALDGIADKYIAGIRAAEQAVFDKNNLNLTSVTPTAKPGEFRAKVDGVKREFKLFVDEYGNFGRSIAELRQLQNKAYLQNKQSQAEQDYARSQGFDPTSDFKYNRREGNGAYSVSRYERMDEFGRRQRQDVRIGQSGEINPAPVGKQYQSFTQGIGKDIGDLLKWSVAISAIYGPINAMSEAMSQLIENESKLADVSIALNSGVADTDKVFSDVYKSAKASGEAVSGVIDAFGAAYTAAGRISNEYQRYNSTVKLLNDSLVLSKLSTLDQAGAIDVLTAALYQTGDANASSADRLSRGTQLIDQWIAVSKIASVSVETLATGVAVLGDSAETAGLSLEQLNALVAVISETSLSSGKETANIAKALIGNYQQESAVKELNRLGIAVVDTTGKTRQFLDVMKDVAALRSQGILGDQDFGRLTLALGGGGIRRQKDVAAFIENFGRMEQIAGGQGSAQGEAADALSKKLDTVQTASTNLANSFVSLAQTMGTKGGLLDMFSGVLGLGTKTVEMFDKIAGAVGKVGPLLLAAGISSFLLGKGGLMGASAALATNFTIPIAERMGLSNPIGAGGNAANILTGNRKFGGIGLPTALAVAAPAIQNFASGDTTEGGANIAGGILGALATGGSPVGALIGSAIAEAFVRTTLTYKSDFADLFAGATIEAGSPGYLGGRGGMSPEELNKQAFKSIPGSGGNELIGKFIAWAVSADTRTNKEGQRFQYNTPGSAGLDILKKTDPELYGKLMATYTQTGGTVPGTTTRLTTRQQDIASEAGMPEYLRKMQLDRQSELRTQMLSGDLKPSDYANRTSSLSAFAVTAPRYMAAIEDQVGGIGDAFKTTEDAYKAFLEILSSGNQESIDYINSYIASIDGLQNILDNLNGQTTDIKFTINGQEVTGGIEDLKNAIAAENAGLAAAITNGAQQARLQNLPIRDIYGGSTSPAPTKDINTVIADTIKMQDKKYNNLEPADYQALKDSWEPFYVLVEEAGKVFYKQVTDAAGKTVDKGLFGEAYQKAQSEGRVSKPGTGLDFSSLDISKPQLEQAVERANQLTKELATKGYEPKVEDTLIATNDEQISKQHVDMKILQYILQQILDTEKKQLQGVWNLPEGASFWVPLQSMIAGSGGGTDGGLKIKDPEVNAPNVTIAKEDYLNKVLEGHPRGATTNQAINLKEKYLKDLEMGPRGATGELSEKKPAWNTERAPASSPNQSIIDQLISKFMSLFTPGSGPLAGFTGVGQGIGTVGGRGYSPSDNSQAITQTKMDIRFTATTNLMVDGRVLASIVKPYLAADLLKTNESGGTITRSYVI